MNKRIKNSSKGLPADYAGLVKVFPLLAIHDAVAYENALELAGQLVTLPAATEEQSQYLEALAILVEAYEHERFEVPDAKPIDVLKLLMEEHGLTASDLGRLLGNRSLGGKILRGERELSKQHIVLLAGHFGISPASLL